MEADEKDEKSFTRRIYQQVEEYAKTTSELYKLKAINTISDVFAAVATGFVIWVIVSLFLLFVSIGGAFYLGALLGKLHYGFFAVGGFYLLLGIIVYAIRKSFLKTAINNFVIKQIFKD